MKTCYPALLLLLIAFPAIFCGCVSIKKQHVPSERPSFFQSEIESRSWVAPDGAVMHFISSTVTNLGAQGLIMIARFGDTNANKVRCLELYRINTKSDAAGQDALVLIDHDWGPRENAWWPSIVTSVEPIVSADKISFKITRETLPRERGERKRLLYFLDYTRHMGVIPNISEWWLPASDVR
jgi:hypothetical protein